MSELTEQKIRDADPADLDRWIAERRGDERYERANGDEPGWIWDSLPHGSTSKAQIDPKPYASEWWAALALLEEMKLSCLLQGDQWVCCFQFDGSSSRWTSGTTAPKAIAKAWLFAYERGLVGGGE